MLLQWCWLLVVVVLLRLEQGLGCDKSWLLTIDHLGLRPIGTDDHDLCSVAVSQRAVESVLGLEGAPGIGHTDLNQREEARDSNREGHDMH